MKPITHLRLRGLVTGRGLLGAPEGALQAADDVTSLLPGTIEPRKGYRQLQAQVAGTTAPAPGDASGVAYGDGQVVQLRKQGADHVLALHDPGAGTSSLSAPVVLHPEGGVPMRSMGRRAYACTGEGVAVVQGAAAREAGVPRALDLTLLLVGTGTGAAWQAVPPDSAVAYRAVWGYRETDAATGETLEQWGAPSARAIYRNTHATETANINVSVPWPGSANVIGRVNLVRIYRTDHVSPAAMDPGDELFLAREIPVSPGATPSAIIVFDGSPDTFLGAPLYTNVETGDGEGAAGANLPPPVVCSDVASWDSRVWYAVHGEREGWTVQLIGTDGFTVGTSELSIVAFDAGGGIVDNFYLMSASSGTSVSEFVVSTGGTPSENVEATARSIVRSLNNNPLSRVFAAYASGVNDPPGLIELTLRDKQSGVGTVLVAMEDSPGAAMFSPRLPTDDSREDQAQIRSVTVRPGVVAFSKPGQPEAVPPLNTLPVGDPFEPIIGMVALRDGIVVAKTDGLYLVYGSGGMYGVQLIDASVRMASDARRGGRGTIQELNNEVYLHAGDQRVYACSASGARAVDTDIQDLLRHREALFAAVDERDGLYCLHLRDTYRVGLAMTDVAVYSMHARAWTRWLTAHFWASQWTSGGLVACSNSDVLSVTRNAGTVEDYQDDGPTSSVQFLASDDGGRTQMLDADSGPAVVSGAVFGDEVFLVSDPAIRGTVLFQRPGDASQRILLHGAPFPTGAPVSVRVAKCIRARIMLAPWHGGSPGGRKRFSYAQFHFDRYGLERVGDGVERAAFGGLGYQTPWVQTQGADGDDGQMNLLISDLDLSWSEINGPWSTMYETPVQPRTVRFAVPKQDQSVGMLSVGLSTKQVNGFWRLSGVTLEVEQGDQKVAR